MAFNYLIVDDSAITRAMIAKSLTMSVAGIGRIDQAAHGREAVAMLEREWYDLVLTDLHMPVMTGMELVAHMRRTELLKETPVVVVTSDGSAERHAAMLAEGVSAILRKPFTPEQIGDVILTLMGEPR